MQNGIPLHIHLSVMCSIGSDLWVTFNNIVELLHETQDLQNRFHVDSGILAGRCI